MSASRRLVFIDETSTSTNMVRLRAAADAASGSIGRVPQGSHIQRRRARATSGRSWCLPPVGLAARRWGNRPVACG